MRPKLCSECGHKLCKTDLFCPECGKEIAELFFCTGCGYESSTAESYCPQCGIPLTDKGSFLSKRRNKVKKVSLKLTSVFLALILIAGIFSYAGAGSFSKMDVMLKGTFQFCTGSSEKACMTLEFLKTPLAENVRCMAEDAAYRKGVKEYGKGNYDIAGNCFQVCSDLGKLDIYNTLVACHRYSYYYNDTSCEKMIQQLSDVWDFEDAPAALMANGCVASYWLEGEWKSEDGERYFILDRENGIKYNLPHTAMGQKYSIENSVMYLYTEQDKSDREDMFVFYPVDMDTLCIYCVSSGTYCNLYRSD